MSKKRIYKYLIIFCTVFTMSLNSIILLPIEVFAKEEYRLELFSQLANKVTSLYFKEAIVGLDIIDDIYSDDMLLKNIEKELNKDVETKKYLLDRGFNSDKIKELLNFIDQTFPSVEQVIEGEEQTENVMGRLIQTTLLKGNGSLNYSNYDENIKKFGTEFYEIMPSGVKDSFDEYFETQEEKRDAIIKIIVEYIYSGHGKGTYNEHTKEYINLELMISDEFIQNVNVVLGVELLDENSKKAINALLEGLEQTIKQKDLDRVYSDINSILNLIETNFIKENREENISNEFEKTEVINNMKPIERKELNRAEILKLTISMINIDPNQYDEEFIDVDKDDFYADYIATGKSMGLIDGYKDNTFRPNSKVTRNEMMSILSNTIEYVNGGEKLSSEEIDYLLKDFKHNKDIAPWAREKTAKLVKAGVIDSDYDEEFGTGEIITRDEAMSIIDNIESLKTSN